jgi:hypothetical protein
MFTIAEVCVIAHSLHGTRTADTQGSVDWHNGPTEACAISYHQGKEERVQAAQSRPLYQLWWPMHAEVDAFRVSTSIEDVQKFDGVCLGRCVQNFEF